MLRYNLDILGWFEFEGLVQTLLKAKLGLGIEAWGGSKDAGKDAYFKGVLAYPSSVKNEGVFVFQCKFVDGANAAGSRPEKNVLGAINEECISIQKRLGRSDWDETPDHYSFFTNSRVGPSVRIKIIQRIQDVLPSCDVHIHDGSDVCSWLDLSQDVCRSFPQILGLRKLEVLLRSWIHSDIIVRSQDALKEAEQLTPIFVPTEAYSQALSILNKHSFSILEGPPEMGKTSIGRIISLAQVARGWEAIECRLPKDILTQYNAKRSQVFIADDFFGRTEYEPTRVSLWQDDLPLILRKLDKEHWLILTSRIHLLNIAKANLDIGEAGNKFPDLGEVIVNADKLTLFEKGRMLYRHAKRANLNASLKTQIKKSAEKIISNTHFTPERIRRLFSRDFCEGMETLISSGREDQFGDLINENLRDPTKGMRVTFKNLSLAHRWFLIAVMEAEFSPNEDSVKDRYEILCPKKDFRPYQEVFHELTEAFIRKPSGSRYVPGIGLFRSHFQWVHPSCRDLVIDELAEDKYLRTSFLSSCSILGLQIATSVGGGREGKRTVPFLVEEQDWQLCCNRALNLCDVDFEPLKVLFQNYEAIRSQNGAHNILEKYRTSLLEPILAYICSESHKRNLFQEPTDLKLFFKARQSVEKYIPTPDATQLWNTIVENTRISLQSKQPIHDQSSYPQKFIELSEILQSFDPSYLKRPSVEAGFKSHVDELINFGSEKENYDFCSCIEELSDYDAVSRGLEEFSTIFEEASELLDYNDAKRERLKELSEWFYAESERVIEEKPVEGEPDDIDYRGGSSGGGSINIGELFKDL